WTRYPQLGKTVFQQQSQQVLCIPPVGFLSAHLLASDLRRVSDPELEPQLVKQTFEPARVSCSLDPHPHFHTALLQVAVEPLAFSVAVSQLLLSAFSVVRVYPCDLLHARVIIATYNHHVRLLSPEPCR